MQIGGMGSLLVYEGLWLILAGIAAVTSYFLIKAYGSRKRSRRLRLPPTPSGAWPILGHMPLLGILPHRNLMKLAKKYGPLMYIRLGYVPAVIVSSSEMVREMFKVNDVIMASRPSFSVFEILAYKNQDIVAAPYGEHWRKMRKLFVQELLSQKRLQDFQVVRRTEVFNAVHSILSRAKTNTDMSVDLKTEFRNLNINNITQMMLGKRYFGAKSESSSKSEEFSKYVDVFTHLAGTFSVGDFVPFLQRFDLQGIRKKLVVARGMFDMIMDNIILERRAGNLHRAEGLRDFVDVLLDNHQKEGLSDEVVKAIIFDTLVGGTDTSSASLEWLMAELVRNPRIMLRVQKELDDIVGRYRWVEESDIPNLKYLVACVKENLRRHPILPLMIPHESTASCTVGGYDLPAKIRVMVNLCAIHMDPASWETPEEFRPERFLDSLVDVRGHHFSLVPFGTGRRICPGMNLGLLMVQYSAAVLLQAYHWSLPEGQEPEHMDMSEDFGIALSKSVPLRLVPSPRLPHHVYGLENIQL